MEVEEGQVSENAALNEAVRLGCWLVGMALQRAEKGVWMNEKEVETFVWTSLSSSRVEVFRRLIASYTEGGS